MGELGPACTAPRAPTGRFLISCFCLTAKFWKFGALSRSPRTGAMACSLLTTVSPQSTFHSAAPTFWYLLVCLYECWVVFRSTCTFATLFALEGRHVLMNSICSRENEMCYGTTEADGVKVDRTMELLCSSNQNPFVNVD